MAVADVAVAMGPRNKRRFTAGVVAFAVVAALAAAVWLMRPPGHSGPGSVAASSNDAGSASSGASGSSAGGSGPVQFYGRGLPVVGGLSYGMTTQQVLRIDGRPTKLVRYQGLPCWQYGSTVRVCFLEGRYTIHHFKINGVWDYQPKLGLPPPAR